MIAIFWIKRFFLVLLGACVLLFIVELVKGHSLADSVGFAMLWGDISASVFTLVGYVRYKRNPAACCQGKMIKVMPSKKP
jgi:hypothetical protein